MQNHQNYRRQMVNNRGTFPNDRNNMTVDNNQNPPLNEQGNESDSRQEGQQERSPQYCQSYSVLAPNENKRSHLLQQRERNMQLYEEAKANNRMKYDGGKPSKIGGPALSKTALLEKRVLEQKKAEALEKRKVYEQKKKRDKWAAEKKSIEEREINERKQKARAQAQRNVEKRRQADLNRKQQFDEERRRRWHNAGNEYTAGKSGKSNQAPYRMEAESHSKPSTDDLRNFYARRYGETNDPDPDSEEQSSDDYDVDDDYDHDEVQIRCNARMTSPRRSNYEFQMSSYDQLTDRFNNSTLEDDSSLSKAAEEDIRKLCEMFPLADKELIQDIYLQTKNSLADTWAILSTK